MSQKKNNTFVHLVLQKHTIHSSLYLSFHFLPRPQQCCSIIVAWGNETHTHTHTHTYRQIHHKDRNRREGDTHTPQYIYSNIRIHIYPQLEISKLLHAFLVRGYPQRFLFVIVKVTGIAGSPRFGDESRVNLG